MTVICHFRFFLPWLEIRAAGDAKIVFGIVMKGSAGIVGSLDAEPSQLKKLIVIITPNFRFGDFAKFFISRILA